VLTIDQESLPLEFRMGETRRHDISLDALPTARMMDESFRYPAG